MHTIHRYSLAVPKKRKLNPIDAVIPDFTASFSPLPIPMGWQCL
jgi:hypothetical protein